MTPSEIAGPLGVTERRVMEFGPIDYTGRRPRRISRDGFGRHFEGRVGND